MPDVFKQDLSDPENAKKAAEYINEAKSCLHDDNVKKAMDDWVNAGFPKVSR